MPNIVVAVPTATKAALGAGVLLIGLPHQFLPKPLEAIKPVIKRSAVAVSLVEENAEIHSGRPVRVSGVISETLGIETAVLVGANLASEVSRGDFYEPTLSTEGSGLVTARLRPSCVRTCPK